jgi:uncharacterized OsmC-like protein
MGTRPLTRQFPAAAENSPVSALEALGFLISINHLGGSGRWLGNGIAEEPAEESTGEFAAEQGNCRGILYAPRGPQEGTVKSSELRELQAPLKERYRAEPEVALITLRARGRLGDEGLTCSVETGRALVEAGLHPATGGDGLSACSGDMLLEALAACAGVTLRAVATALEIEVRGGTVSAEGDLDFRGTLGVSREAPVGFRDIRLRFDLDTDAPAEKLESLIRLTERYCVVYQTLAKPPKLTLSSATTGG